jgi:hypothetical protein
VKVGRKTQIGKINFNIVDTNGFQDTNAIVKNNILVKQRKNQKNLTVTQMKKINMNMISLIHL